MKFNFLHCNCIKEYSKFKGYLALSVLLICYIVFLCSNITSVEAANVLTLDNTSPPQVIIGEYYRWQIPISGGNGPYRYRISGDLPNGLYDSTNGYIVGAATLPQNRSAYQVRISVTDSSSSYTEQIYVFDVVYKATISVTGTTPFGGETNVYINGIQSEKLSGTSPLTMLFPLEEEHSVRIDNTVYDTTDNNTRYVFSNTYIYPISNSSTKAIFTFVTEHYLKASTKPEGICSLFSSNWYSLSNWYKDGSQISYDALPEVKYNDKPDTKYSFSYWTSPGGQQQIENKLVLPVNEGGEIIANYDTWYKLTINSRYGAAIEGEAFYLAGSTARWRITGGNAPPASDIIGYNLGIKQMPAKSEDDNVVMDSPKTINIQWVNDSSSFTAPLWGGLNRDPNRQCY